MFYKYNCNCSKNIRLAYFTILHNSLVHIFTCSYLLQMGNISWGYQVKCSFILLYDFMTGAMWHAFAKLNKNNVDVST